MKKFNWVDVLIILLVIAVAASGYLYLNRGKGNVSVNNTEIYFTVEVQKLSFDVANSYIVGERATFGTKNADSGIVTNLDVKPHTQDLPNALTGQFERKEIEGWYNAYVTIKTEGIETDSEIRSPQEPLNIGAEMIFHGKGFAGKGYITGLKTQNNQ